MRIVCKVSGNPSGIRLWWFVDGAFAGESDGSAPHAVEVQAGEHVITCSTADGRSAAVCVTVTREHLPFSL